VTAAARENRWGAASPSTDEECRQLILQAAASCFYANGPMRATVDDIARAASVHRTTVYKYFPNRPAIISAVLLWEADELISEAAAFYDSPGPFAERFVAAFRHVVEGVRRSRFLRRLFDPDAVDAVVHATAASQAFRDRVSLSLRDAVARAAELGELRPDLDLDEVVEWLGSIALLLLGESFRDETLDTVMAMQRYVLPGISVQAV
jgi:AcrR family transcriptional regulator